MGSSSNEQPKVLFLVEQKQHPLLSNLPLVFIIITTCLGFLVSVLCLLSGWTTIFQNLFYFPIILACLFYTRKGFFFSMSIVVGYLGLMVLFSRDGVVLAGAIVRSVIFVMVAAVIAYLSTIVRQDEEIRRQLAEKEILLREIHHRVKNNIAHIAGLLSLQAAETENPEVKGVLREALGRVESMRALYDTLLISDDYRMVSIGKYVESLIASLKEVFASQHIVLDTSIAEFDINAKKAVALGMIINELLTNVFKYAFKDRGEGRVLVSIEKSGTRGTLIIQDNGVGFDGNLGTGGLGLSIVRMLVEQLKGTYVLVSDKGTKSVIGFDL